MSQDPISRLLAEHVHLQRLFNPLRELLARHDAGRPETPERAEAVMHEVSRVMSTELIAHAHREDTVFFPAVEERMGVTFAATHVMRLEHAEIHRGADLFRDTLRELHEVDHPAIVEAGEALEAELSQPGDVTRLYAIGRSLLGMIDAHFAKEEQILFPMSRELLDADALRTLAARMEEADARPR